MSHDVARTSLTADPRGLAGLKRDVRAGDDSPETLRAVAKQFESLFARMLIKSMRETSFGDGLMDSEQGEFYRDLFDQQLAVELSEGRGLGLADMLMQQLAGGATAAPSTTTTTTAPTTATTPTGVDAGAPAAAKTGADWRPAGREDFVRQLWPHAAAAGEALGVDPTTIVAHAALETGWGRSLPRQADGQTSYNLFGIKAGAGWQGATAPTSTLEFRDGGLVRGVENFRAYDTLGAGLGDYARLLSGSPRYAGALNTGSDTGAFAQALQRAGYATDPAYASKLESVARQLRAMLDGGTPLKSAANRPLTPATSGAT